MSSVCLSRVFDGTILTTGFRDVGLQNYAIYGQSELERNSISKRIYGIAPIEVRGGGTLNPRLRSN